MGEYKFGVTGQDRKALVSAISEILNRPSEYLGAPDFKYQVGQITINKEGTAIGQLPFRLLSALAERGFTPNAEEPEIVSTEANDDAKTEATEEISESNDESEFSVDTGDTDAIEAEVEEEPSKPETSAHNICITIPLQGFTPESLDNLIKMVLSKENLIKKALGVTELPIKVLDDSVVFDWFKSANSEDMEAYTQFIECLTATAKEKKRVVAKPRDFHENEKFSMRIWLIGLGLIGQNYSRIRKLMGANLDGNSAFRYGIPEKTKKIAATEADNAAEETPTDETPAKPEPSNVAEITAATADESVGDNTADSHE